MFAAAGAHAQFATQSTPVNTSVDRAFDPAPKDCNEVRWSQSTLQVFPSIGSACQAIEQRNDKTYVKLEGKVEDVKGQGKRIRVDFEDGEELTFRPTPRTALYIDGERTSFADLEDGTRLNFYIPEDRLQAELQPEPDRLAFIIFPFDVTTTAAAPDGGSRDSGNATAMNDELPRTAGPLPFIGFGGAALLMLAVRAALRRKRLERQESLLRID
jgi:hypothetical protein